MEEGHDARTICHQRLPVTVDSGALSVDADAQVARKLGQGNATAALGCHGNGFGDVPGMVGGAVGVRSGRPPVTKVGGVSPKSLGDGCARPRRQDRRVGCNFEDQVVGGEAASIECRPADRGRARRSATSSSMPDRPVPEGPECMTAMLERCAAGLCRAGASGFFVPSWELRPVRRLCVESPIPGEFHDLSGVVTADVAHGAGVARISHGPFPFMAMLIGSRRARAALA